MYRLEKGKGIKTTKQPIFDTDKNIEISFNVPKELKSYKFTAKLTTEKGKRTSLKLKDYKIILPDSMITPQTIKLSVQAELDGKNKVNFVCEPIVIESLEKLTEKLQYALPDYMKLPRQYNDLKAELEAVKKQNNLLIDKINSTYAPLIVKLDKKIKFIEASYDLLQE